MKKSGGSRGKPEVSTSQVIRAKSRSRSRSDTVLTLDDINCPICLNIFIHPVTLPCNHTLCHQCFCRSIRITALSCPFCRLRLSVWSRRAIKEKTLINHAFMRKIRKQFPAVVADRLEELKREQEEREEEEEEDEEKEEVNSLLVRTAERTPTSGSESSYISEQRLGQKDSEEKRPPKFDGVLSKPGEIAKEYMTLLQKYQSECDKQKQKQISKSEALIEKLTQEDNELQKPSLSTLQKNSGSTVKKSTTTTVNGKNKKRKSNNVVVVTTKENSLNSSTSISLDSGIYLSASSSSFFSTPSSASSSTVAGPSRQSKIQILNTYNTPSTSSSPSVRILLDDVDVEAEKEAFERYKSKLEQEENDRKMAQKLQREIRKMDLGPPSKRITRSHVPNTRSRLASRSKS